jgi:hypothetical protein
MKRDKTSVVFFLVAALTLTAIGLVFFSDSLLDFFGGSGLTLFLVRKNREFKKIKGDFRRQ